MKKVLSLVLVIAMVLSSMSFAFAGTFEDVTGDYEDAVEALVALGVVSGYEDGTFRPEKTITRAELAKILVEALGYGELVAGAKSNFTDTQNHWANGYVAIAAGTGLVVGYPNGTFLPDKAVTYDEALTMVVRAIGYTDSSLKGTWPTNYKVKAIDLDLTDDVVMASSAADRGGVAQILFNALETPMVEIDEDGVVVKVQPEKLVIDNIASPTTIDVTEDTLDPDHDDYAGDIVDLEPYMFENLDVYVNDDDEVVYVKDSNSTVYEGVFDDIDQEGADVELDIEEADGDIEEVDFEDVLLADEIDGVVYKNGKIEVDEDELTYADLEDTDTIKVVFNEDEDGDDVLTGIVVTLQTNAALVENEYRDGRTYVDEFDLPVDEDGDVDFDLVTVKGAVESVEEIAEDDVVVEYAAYDADGDIAETTLVVSRDTVEGKIKKVDGSKFYIDGVSYEENAIANPELALGNDGVFYLDHNGDVVAFDGDTSEPTDYAVIVGVSDGSTEVDRYGNEAIDEYPQLKLVTQEGEEAYYDIYVDIDFDDEAGSEGDEIEDGDDFVALEDTDAEEYDLVIDADFAVDTLIKFSMNSDGQIDDMEVVQDLTADVFDTVDLDKSSDKLASDIVIFEMSEDGDDYDYDVIEEDDLKTEFEAFEDRNSSGEIKILVVAPGELDTADDTFAYIYDVSPALDDDDDDVAYLEAYYAGEDTAFYTTDDYTDVDFDANTVIIVDLDGELIDDDATAHGTVATASAISYSSELLKIDGVWYSLADNATVVREEYIDGELDDTDLVDLGDIDEETTEFTYYTTNDTDREIGLIVFRVNK